MTSQIELRHLKYFMAVAEELHFRKAAEKLFISQPGLSRQIRQLEEQLGVSLISRTNRKVELTAAGQHLATEALTWLEVIQQGLEKTKLIHESAEGTLKLGYVGSAMQGVVPELLEQFKSKHPTVKFSLSEMDNSMQLTALLDGTIDVGFVRLSHVPKSIEMKTVLTEPFCLVLPKNHVLTKAKLKHMNQLREESFILFEKEYSPTYYEEVMSLFRDAGYNPLVSHSSVNALTIYKMVESGFGLAVVPKSLKNTFSLQIKFIDLSNFSQRTNLNVIWKKSNSNPMLKFVLEELKL
ncbi:MAG: LysR family transcriptional regulator [Flavobacteriales bacterium]